MSLLITPSLIGAIDWLSTCPRSWRDAAYADLTNQLARVWSEPNKACKLGITFENTVYKEVNAKTDRGSDLFKWFVAKCQGGQFQRKTTQYVTVDATEFCLYGKMDAWWPEKIYDIKTTSNYKGAEKYLDSIQHKIYCLNEHINHFEYLVAVFNEDEKLVAKECIKYDVADFNVLKEEVYERISLVYRYLKSDPKLIKLYTEVFSKRS